MISHISSCLSVWINLLVDQHESGDIVNDQYSAFFYWHILYKQTSDMDKRLQPIIFCGMSLLIHALTSE